MKTPVFQHMIAPCGMNCGICIGHLRDKNPCGGCFRSDDPNKPKACRSCSIANCTHIDSSMSGFCYDCEKMPCTRLRKLDERYRKNYGMSMLDNLAFIQNKGMAKFLEKEEERWSCQQCGSVVSVHRGNCLNCNAEVIRDRGA